jgi:hypothetical protein
LRPKGITFAFVAFLFSCQGTAFDRFGSMLGATRPFRPHHPSPASPATLCLVAPGSLTTNDNRFYFNRLLLFPVAASGAGTVANRTTHQLISERSSAPVEPAGFPGADMR